jgi:hypothetical protein
MALPKERIQISLTEFLKATMAGGAVVSLAGGSHCDGPEARDAAGRKGSLDEAQLAAWVKQASQLPGERM